MLDNHLETIKQVAQHLETIVEKIDSLDFCPILWEDSYFLLHELEAAEEQIDNLSAQLKKSKAASGSDFNVKGDVHSNLMEFCFHPKILMGQIYLLILGSQMFPERYRRLVRDNETGSTYLRFDPVCQ